MEKSLVILVVDDEPAIARALARALKGHTVLTAESGEAGLRVMAAQQDENGGVDVVFSDMDMPGMNGLEFLTIVRETYRSTYRILMSGDVDRLEIKHACRLTENKICHYLIQKPWRDSDISKSLEQVLNEKAALSASPAW